MSNFVRNKRAMDFGENRQPSVAIGITATIA